MAELYRVGTTRRQMAALGAALTAGCFACLAGDGACTGRWLAGDPIPSFDGVAYKAFSYLDGVEPKLVVGGELVAAGDVVVENVTWFDGSRWRAMGAGLDGRVEAFESFEGGLVAGGSFLASGGTAINRVARWDGSNWQPIGGGVSGRVSALAVYQGELYAAGAFGGAEGQQTRFIARWNGVQWRPVGTGFDNLVSALTVYDGKLIAAGSFTTAGDAPTAHIAQWDGSAWSALGAGLSASATCLQVHDGKLYVGGSFQIAGGIAARRVAVWDGANWSALGAGLPTTVFSLTVHDGQVIAGGPVWVSAWDGVLWHAAGLSSTLHAGGMVLVHEGELLSVGRGMSYISGINVLHGDTWQDYSLVTWNARVDRLFAIDKLLIGDGPFSRVPGTAAARAAVWDGAGWSRMDAGLDLTSNPISNIYSVVQYRGDVIGGGDFRVEDAGGTETNNLARWNGERWVGFAGGSSTLVSTLVADGDNLYAVGSLLVRRYDGNAWTTLVGGLRIQGVNGVAVFQGSLYATGRFLDVESKQVKNFARWDGAGWVSTPLDLIGSVVRLDVLGSSLVFWGPNFRINGVVGTIFAWDGSTASRLLESGSNVSGVAALRDSLVAVGVLHVPQSTTVARWRNGVWSAFPTAPSEGVSCVASSGSLLGVGGSFTITDGVISTSVALWRDESADFNGDGVLTGEDFDLFVQALEAGEIGADFDDDGFVTGQDFDHFVQAFEAGC